MGGGSKPAYPRGVSPCRDTSIRVDFTFMGVRCREFLPLSPTKANIKFAADKLAVIRHEIARETFRYSEHFPQSPKVALFEGVNQTVTVGGQLRKYLAAIRKTVARSTWESYDSAARTHILPAFDSTPLQNLTTSDIRAWVATIQASNKRINNVLIPLRSMLKDAVMDGIIDRNPMDRVRNLPLVQDDPDPFTVEEIRLFLAAIHDRGCRNFYQLAFWTGLRTSEEFALEWGDVDWVRGELSITKAYVSHEIKATKTSSGRRRIRLLPPALDALKDQRELTFLAGGRIFRNPNSGQPWDSADQPNRICWGPAIRRAGLRCRNPYQTRHTFASLALMAGENPMWVAQQMGHKDWGMIRKVYGRWIPGENLDAGSKMMEAYGEGETAAPRQQILKGDSK